MSCYEEVRQLTTQAFDPAALDAALEQYGSEVYIAAAVRFALHGSRFEITDRLIECATELIDWEDPPATLVGLLEVIDHEGALKSGNPAACRSLCQNLTEINNMPYRIALFAVFAYYLQLGENSNELRARLAEEHLAALHFAEITD